MTAATDEQIDIVAGALYYLKVGLSWPHEQDARKRKIFIDMAIQLLAKIMPASESNGAERLEEINVSK